jgi:hypothetical protein
MKSKMNSQQADIDHLLIRCVKVITELTAFDKWINKENLNVKYKDCKIEAINESIELLTKIYPHLSQLQQQQAFEETCDLLGIPQSCNVN